MSDDKTTPEVEPEPEFPRWEGDTLVLGPDVFVDRGGLIISWRGENFYTIEKARALIAAETPAKLTDYKQGEQVEVLDPKAGVWREGFISSIDRISNHLHVDTERGPITVASTGRIRRRSVSASDE